MERKRQDLKRVRGRLGGEAAGWKRGEWIILGVAQQSNGRDRAAGERIVGLRRWDRERNFFRKEEGVEGKRGVERSASADFKEEKVKDSVSVFGRSRFFFRRVFTEE